MADVKIGKVSFNIESLKGITLLEAYDKFSYVRKDFVKEAYIQVNGKIPRKRRKKSD